jgi:zinc protease
MKSPLSPENVTRHVLSNGLTVLVKENHSAASIVVRGRMLAGAVWESARRAGVADFTASALNRGTDRFSFRHLNEEFDRLGLRFGVNAGVEAAGFSGKCLTEDFDNLLGIAEQVLRYPTFPEREVEKLRSQLITDVREAADDTHHVAHRTFRELLFPPSHPYHHPPEGTERTLRSITRADLVKFHKQHVRPDQIIMVLVGDVHAEDAFAKLEEHFGDWKVKGKPPRFEIADLTADTQPIKKEIGLKGKFQSDLVIGFPGIRRADPDYYALSLADLIFGRMGLNGRVGAHVREELGLAYYVYSSLEASVGAGPWSVSGGVNPKNVDRALEAILTEIKTLRDQGVTEDELNEAQDFLTGFLALRLETNDGVASSLNDIEFFGLGLDYFERYPDIIRGVTREQIHAAVQKFARVETAVTVVVGPDA